MSNLQEQSSIVFPEFKSLIEDTSFESDSAWNSDIKTGKSLEILTLIKIISLAKKNFKSFKIGDLFTPPLQNLFYLRNEIPLHHGAQAGHEGSLISQISLENRFLAAITPRATFEFNGSSWMIFREGNPIHLIFALINGQEQYKDRCDLAIVRGTIEDIVVKNNVLYFSHVDHNESAHYEISIKNTPILPLKNFNSTPDYTVITGGVIECSVSKSKSHVDSQLKRYEELFSVNDNKPPACLFIHGGRERSQFKTLLVNLDNLPDSIDEENSSQVICSFLYDCCNAS